MEAIEDTPGNLGCSKSHAKALEYAIQKGFSRFLIVEDDFELCVSPEVFQAKLWEMASLDFDVLMLAHNTSLSSRHNANLIRVQSSQTRSAYVVNAHFAPALLKNFREAIDLMTRLGKVHHAHGDQHWKLLQPLSKWYAFEPRLAKQRASYSDNEKAFAN